MNSRRMNRLEELGRVDAERADTRKGARNLRDEKSRIVRELKADGGYITKKKKPSWITKKKTEGKLLPESGSKYITKKKKTGPYITKKKKYITKKSPAQIQDRERMRRSEGGSLKPVQPNQKGLKKLPTKVRNKMGYMKKGGRVGMGKAMRGGGCVR
jgi:hypothetical protein